MVCTQFSVKYSGRELIRQINVGDTINSITIEGNARGFLESRADRVYQWNVVLDERFPNLKEALTD